MRMNIMALRDGTKQLYENVDKVRNRYGKHTLYRLQPPCHRILAALGRARGHSYAAAHLGFGELDDSGSLPVGWNSC